MALGDAAGGADGGFFDGINSYTENFGNGFPVETRGFDDGGGLEDESVLLHHNEPIWRGDEMVGYVTDGMWGHSVGAAVGMGWVDRGERFTKDWLTDADWFVEVPGKLAPARVQLGPLLR